MRSIEQPCMVVSHQYTCISIAKYMVPKKSSCVWPENRSTEYYSPNLNIRSNKQTFIAVSHQHTCISIHGPSVWFQKSLPENRFTDYYSPNQNIISIKNYKTDQHWRSIQLKSHGRPCLIRQEKEHDLDGVQSGTEKIRGERSNVVKGKMHGMEHQLKM